MKVLYSVIFCIIFYSFSYGQSERLPYVMYPNKMVFHTSLSLNNAPFKLRDNFGGFDKISFKPNLNLVQGLGIAYKWFALEISYKLPGHIRNTEKFGKTKYFDLGLQFSYLNWDFAVNFDEYKGYGIKNAGIISNNLDLSPSGYFLNSNIKSRSFGINAYRFFNPELRMKPAVGIVGRYTAPVHGAYLRLTTNIHGISAKKGLIPFNYLNTSSSIHKANSISAFDFGAVPGYGYINNIDGWQFGAFFGLGAVIQAKFYTFSNTSRGFLGLAPRIDLKLQAGYNVDNWFLMLTSQFDQKSIRFKEFKYNQTYYYLRLTYGYRFNYRIKLFKRKSI
ncbi:DUF4421 domain-containing protein [Brumimicrobium glaciale]|uniref:DUF4421 domain-containing protein n=2 Tax=Brumimicrobium glaciale TaxID=200475 RepID=A0A4Q4KIH2_9FLAO|nr:DUF4421 domain-containing protein [Brumimicrobium glaciale]